MPNLRSAPLERSPPPASKAPPPTRAASVLSKADHASATTTPPPAAETPSRSGSGTVAAASGSGGGGGGKPRAAKRPRSVRNVQPLDGRDYQPTQVVQSQTGEYSATMLRKAQLLRKIKEHAQSARAAAHAAGRGCGRAGPHAPVFGASMALGHWDHNPYGAPACALLGASSRDAYGCGDGYADWRGSGAPSSQPSSYEGAESLQQQQTAHAHSAVVRAHIAYAAQQRLRQQQRRRQEIQDAMAALPRRELAPGQLLQCAGLDGGSPLPQFALHSPPRAPLPRFDSSSHLHDLGSPTDTAAGAAQLRYQAQPPPPPHAYQTPRAPPPPSAHGAERALHAADGGADAAEPETARVRERILQLAHQLVLASSALGRGEPESERVLSTLIRTLRALPQGALAPPRDEECASADALRLDSPSSALQPAYLFEQMPACASELEPLRGFAPVPALECFDSRCGGGGGGDVDGSTIASCAPSGAGPAANDDHAAFDASSPWGAKAQPAQARARSASPAEPAPRDGAAAARPRPPPAAVAACPPGGALGALAEPPAHALSRELEPDELDELDLMDFSTLARGTNLIATARAAPGSHEHELLGRIGQAFSSQWRAELDEAETLLSRPSDEVLDDIISSLNAVA